MAARFGDLIGGLLAIHSRLYGLGSKYDIAPLLAAALKRFQSAAKHGVDKEDLALAIRITFGSTSKTDRGLRDLVMQVIFDNICDLLEYESFVNAIKNINGLMLKILKYQTYKRFVKKIACRISCAASSNRNRHSFVSCDFNYETCCDNCHKPSFLLQYQTMGFDRTSQDMISTLDQMQSHAVFHLASLGRGPTI